MYWGRTSSGSDYISEAKSEAEGTEAKSEAEGTDLNIRTYTGSSSYKASARKNWSP
jgi:hypothetical protein